jgi:hypothetical protein
MAAPGTVPVGLDVVVGRDCDVAADYGAFDLVKAFL